MLPGMKTAWRRGGTRLGPAGAGGPPAGGQRDGGVRFIGASKGVVIRVSIAIDNGRAALSRALRQGGEADEAADLNGFSLLQP